MSLIGFWYVDPMSLIGFGMLIPCHAELVSASPECHAVY
jgi:hypothetical protein